MATTEKARIVICGGGIVGASIAYQLSLRSVAANITITVIEQTKVAAAASGKAGGFLAGGCKMSRQSFGGALHCSAMCIHGKARYAHAFAFFVSQTPDVSLPLSPPFPSHIWRRTWCILQQPATPAALRTSGNVFAAPAHPKGEMARPNRSTPSHSKCMKRLRKR